MKDSLAGIIGTAGAGIVQIAETTGVAPDNVTEDTLASGAISLIVGLISMLLSRFLNKIAAKKKNPKV